MRAPLVCSRSRSRLTLQIFCSTSLSINVNKIFKIVLARAFDLKVCTLPYFRGRGRAPLTGFDSSSWRRSMGWEKPSCSTMCSGDLLRSGNPCKPCGVSLPCASDWLLSVFSTKNPTEAPARVSRHHDGRHHSPRRYQKIRCNSSAKRQECSIDLGHHPFTCSLSRTKAPKRVPSRDATPRYDSFRQEAYVVS